MYRFLLIFLLSFYFISSGKAQFIGAGADVMYNFQTESFGAGARVNFFPNNRLSFVPEFSYYFPSNKITEFYAGLAIEIKFIMREKVNFYGILHGGYNSWNNYSDSNYKNAQQNNWDAEGGIGVSNNKCLRPFLEYRYNVKFRETHLRLGILYIFGCKSKPKNNRCSAY